MLITSVTLSAVAWCRQKFLSRARVASVAKNAAGSPATTPRQMAASPLGQIGWRIRAPAEGPLDDGERLLKLGLGFSTALGHGWVSEIVSI